MISWVGLELCHQTRQLCITEKKEPLGSYSGRRKSPPRGSFMWHDTKEGLGRIMFVAGALDPFMPHCVSTR